MIFHDRKPQSGWNFLNFRTKFDINNRQVLSCLENIVRRKEIWQELKVDIRQDVEERKS